MNSHSGGMIRSARKAGGYSRKQVSEVTRVSLLRIRQIERGEVEPTPREIRLLLTACNCGD